MGQSLGQIQNPFGGSSFGANAAPDLMSNANLAPMPDATFGTGIQPSGVGVSNNLGAGAPLGVGDVGQMTDLTSTSGMGGAIPMTPTTQATAGVANTGPNWKGMAQDLGKGMLEYNKMKEKEKAAAAPSPQLANKPNQTPLQIGMAANQAAPQANVSGAMQAIMGGLSPQNRQLGIMNLIGQ